MRYLSIISLAVLIVVSLDVKSFAASSDVERSVLTVIASKQPVDLGSPWQRQRVDQIRHLGTLIEGGMILTTAFAVADAAFIELQRFGSRTKHELKLRFIDYEVNLALLEPGDKSSIKGMQPMALAADLPLDSEAAIYTTRDLYQLTSHPMRLSEVGIYRSITSSYSLVSYLFKVQQSGLGWAEPVVRQGRLVALTSGQDKNHVYAVPATIIRHFIEDSHDGKYRGFPAAGISLQSLVSPDLRKLIKADKYAGGIRISEVHESSSFAGKLCKDDVLLALAGKKLSEHGFYTHSLWGKIHLKYLINKLYSGDEITFEVLRDGKVINVTGKLERYFSNQALIPHQRYDRGEPHLIFGGVVVQELSRPYLEQWGNNWNSNAPSDLLYMWDFENHPVKDGSRLLIVSRVLADEFNRGYDKFSHQLVRTVNGKEVHSLAELGQVLQEGGVQRDGKRYAVFTLQRDGGEIVLGYDGLPEVHSRIAETYGITTPASFFQSAK